MVSILVYMSMDLGTPEKLLKSRSSRAHSSKKSSVRFDRSHSFRPPQSFATVVMYQGKPGEAFKVSIPQQERWGKETGQKAAILSAGGAQIDRRSMTRKFIASSEVLEMPTQ